MIQARKRHKVLSTLLAASSFLSACGEREALRPEATIAASTSPIQPAVALEIGEREPILSAPVNVLDVPTDIKTKQESNTISVLGCSGKKVFINMVFAGAAFAEHCLVNDLNAQTILYQDYNIPIYDGKTRGSGNRYLLNSSIAFPDIDTAFGALDGFTPEQVAQAFFDQAGNWDDVEPGSRVYFSCYPRGYESPNYNKLYTFVGTYVGDYSVHVFGSATASNPPQWDVSSSIVITNLTQDGFGGIPACSGAIGTAYDANGSAIANTGALDSYEVLVAGRQTSSAPPYTPEQAAKSQQRAKKLTGYRLMAHIMDNFGNISEPGEPITVVFLGRSAINTANHSENPITTDAMPQSEL